MNRTLTLISSAGLAFALISSVSMAKGLTPHVISPQQKQVSDQHVSDGLVQEQAALAALQSGNTAGCIADCQTAYADMHQAMPIYHGYRARSMGAVKHVGTALGSIKNPKGGAKRLPRLEAALSKAISDAQAALQNSSLVLTPADRER